jgi:predicted RNase H-like HicB family nuclease
MSREFTVVVEKDQYGYFIGTVPQIQGCHTQAKSLDKLMERMKEAVLLCLEAAGETVNFNLSESRESLYDQIAPSRRNLDFYQLFSFF